MANTVNTGWLKDHNGEKFAPKTLTSQVQTSDGILLDDKIQADLNEAISKIPTKTSELTNDSGYLTSFTETDPTVPAWAKQPNKPSYSASEVGALEKTTYEYNRQLDISQSGKVCIGKFPMYDSIIAVTINSSTDVTYHGTLVIATQNISTNLSGVYKATVYGDADNSLTDRIKIEYVNGSNVFSVYIDLPLYSKHFLHIQFISSRGEPTNIATLVSEIPSTATIVPTNALKTQFNGKANTTHTHTKSEITDFPTSMPASDVYSWAKASSKPTYTASEVGLSTENWTFTYEDGSTRVVEVYVK